MRVYIYIYDTIGQTRNEILTRMNQHRQNGAFLEHMSTHHHIATVSLDELSSNVKILKVIPDFKKLIIYEALTILHKKPDLNRQIDNFVNPLKLFARSYHPAPPARVTPPHIRTEPIIHNNTGPTIQNRYSLMSRET